MSPIDPAAGDGPAVTTIPLGARVCDLVVGPRNVYVAAGESVMVISGMHHIVATIGIAHDPKRMILSADGSFLYVTGYDGSVSIINTTDNTCRIVANSPSIAEVVSPDGKRMYSAHQALSEGRDSWISVIDANGATVTTAPVQNYPTGMDLSPDGSRLYVATSAHSSYRQYYSGWVSVIDTASHTVVDTIAVPRSPSGVTVSPDGSRIFITHYDTNAITAVDPVRRNVTSLFLSDAPLAAAVTPDCRQVYVTGLHSLTVVDFDVSATDTIAVGDLPRRLHFSDDAKLAYVTDFGRHAVTVVDTITNSVVTTVDIGGNPEALALSSDGERLYVADYWAGALTAIAMPSVMRDVGEA